MLDNPFYIISGILPPSHICNGPGQHHTSMAMVRDIHSHLHDGPGYHTSTSTMVRGNIILAWQWSGTSIHVYRCPGISQLNIHNGPGQHHSSMAMLRDIHNGPGQHYTSMAMVRGNIIVAWQWSRTSTMVQGNIILAWQWSGTSIHIYGWPGISQLNIHNGPGQHHSSMAMVRDIHNGPGEHHTSMAMVRDIHSHLQMVRDITSQYPQWSGATSF